MSRIEVPATRIGGSYIQDDYPFGSEAFVRVCKDALNKFFVVRVGPYWPKNLIFVLDTNKPEGDDYLAIFPQSHGAWYDLRLAPDSLYSSFATYPCVDDWMNQHFLNRRVVYAWVEYPDEND